MSVVAWGYGKSGALGNGELQDQLYPVVVSGQLRGKHVVAISCGEQHSMALDELGIVYVWGRNREGQCGQGTVSDSFPSPCRVDGLLHERIVKIVAGNNQSFAITDEGKLYRWGLFHERSLNATPQYFGISGMRHISDETREMIDRSHYLYFSNKTEVDVHDRNDDVETVAAFKRKSIPEPEVLDIGGKRVVDVAAGYCFYLVVTEDGSLYSFGFNDKGQLGLGTRFSQDKPQLITTLQGIKVINAVAGQQHSVVITQEGHVYSWGGGVFGLGHGEVKDLLFPKRIDYLLDQVVTHVATGTYHTFCITDIGKIYSFGHGEYGQQGTGDFGERGEQSRNALFPREVCGAPWLNGKNEVRIQSVECGHLHTLFTISDGSIWSCGWGTSGVLGHGDAKYRLFPTQVTALDGESILASSGGWKHSMAIKQGSTTFAMDFEKLLTAQKNTDITFIVDKKPLHAHRAIVCTRCPKIKAMAAFTEKYSPQKGKLEISVSGTRFVVFKAMIYFLYTDHLNIPPYFAPEVAHLARRFGLSRLCGLCQQLYHRSKLEKINLPLSTFSSDLAEMIDEQKYSDICFTFFDREPIFAHKQILTSRCPYFEALFDVSKGFQDSHLSSLSFAELPFPTSIFLLILQYIYTGSNEIVIPEVAVDLLAASDYFMLDDLKRICEDVIEKNVESEKEILEDILDSATMFGAKRLAYYCSLELRKLESMEV